MDIIKVEKICRPLRIVVGLVLIALGFITGNALFYIGILPLIVGIAGWRPFCKFTGKCSFKE
ncbi:MAG: DUF2892 domain-containing protein [Campylobacterales bacterium]|nr:DUF2892 domain-containing protein [Campylobacterales bacterium]